MLSIKVAEYPAFISPVRNRKLGGGYEPFNPDDEDAQAELRRQGGVSLNAWLERYRGACENVGLDMSSVENLIRVLRDDSRKKKSLKLYYSTNKGRCICLIILPLLD